MPARDWRAPCPAHDEAPESDVRERVSWLEQFYTGIVRCRVLVEVPHQHRHYGRHFHIRIEVTVPGGPPIVVSHEPSPHGGLKDTEDEAHHKENEIESVHRHASVAIHEAFDAARRRLEDFAREQRGTVKTHDIAAHGEVVELTTVDGYGFILPSRSRAQAFIHLPQHASRRSPPRHLLRRRRAQ